MADASNRTFSIYGLVDADDPAAIRYVGMTVQPLKERLRRHIAGGASGETCSKAEWIRDVLAKGGNVRPVMLETKADEAAEQRWISYLAECGHDLLNERDGGLAGFTVHDRTRARMSAAQAQAQNRPEQKTKNSRSNRETFSRPEMKARMAALRKQIMARPEVRAKLREAANRRWADPAMRSKMIASFIGRKCSPETAKLRSRPGEANPNAVLTENDVRAIRAASANGATGILIAQQYGVSKSLVGAILRRESWKHVF